MTDEQFEELQSDTADIRVSDIGEHLSCAASCETKEDFVSNITNAIEETTALLVELKNIKAKAKHRKG